MPKKTDEAPPKMGRPNEMPPPWSALADAAGGVAPLAERLGVSTMTVWRWSQGGGMYGPTRIAIEAIATELGVPSPLEDG